MRPYKAYNLDLLKLLRSQRMSRAEICAELGWAAMTVDWWCRECLTQGFLVAEPSETCSRNHKPTMLYTLSPTWKGRE